MKLILKLNYKLVLKIILVCCFWVFCFMFFVLVRNSSFPRRPLYSTPEDYGMEFEDVEFLTQDNFILKGWLISNDMASPTIIICHGFGTNRSDVLVLADFLFDAGYNILLFDFRGHGESQGWYTSFGYQEKRDLQAAVDFLRDSQGLERKEFGVIGVSMGGSIAILVAAEDQDIKAVVADSSYVDLDRSIIRHTRFMLKVPFSGFLGRLAILSYRLRFFTDSSKISPVKEISQISSRPVMIISGTKDPRMPPQDAEELYLHARQPKELFLTVSAGHSESYWQDTKEYQRRVIDFFDKNLPR
ncbi:MAG: alpha/beta hydrolase [Candidatus Omnitrophota bacterium]